MGKTLHCVLFYCNILNAFLLRLVAVSAGAPGSSTTGPGANTVRPPGTPLSMHWLQVQLLVHAHPVSAVLHGSGHKRR